ncbi:MAG TPA: GNAT family N-acetyltransferase [Burkholderiales bacterium]|nr:GNAT family N-acetyltransferase [Burkholderiales bacterium]
MTAVQIADPGRYAESWPLLHAHSLTIRALQPEHADLEVRFGLALSPQSRYERFLGGGVKLSPELLARLVNVDLSRDAALIATVAFAGSETPIGVGRYVRVADEPAAEIAVTVADAWQGCGLGRLLLERVIDAARRNGLRRLTGDVLAANAPMLALARRFGFRIEPHPEGGGLRRVVKDLDDDQTAALAMPASVPATEA